METSNACESLSRISRLDYHHLTTASQSVCFEMEFENTIAHLDSNVPTILIRRHGPRKTSIRVKLDQTVGYFTLVEQTSSRADLWSIFNEI